MGDGWEIFGAVGVTSAVGAWSNPNGRQMETAGKRVLPAGVAHPHPHVPIHSRVE